MPVGRRKVNITQQDHPFGQVGPMSAAAALTRFAAKSGLGKGGEKAAKEKSDAQNAGYAAAMKQIKSRDTGDKTAKKGSVISRQARSQQAFKQRSDAAAKKLVKTMDRIDKRKKVAKK